MKFYQSALCSKRVISVKIELNKGQHLKKQTRKCNGTYILQFLSLRSVTHFFNNFPHKEFELWATLMLSCAENDKTDNDDDAVAKLRLFFQTKLTNKEFT